MIDILDFIDMTIVDYISATPTSLMVKVSNKLYEYEWNGKKYELCK